MGNKILTAAELQAQTLKQAAAQRAVVAAPPVYPMAEALKTYAQGAGIVAPVQPGTEVGGARDQAYLAQFYGAGAAAPAAAAAYTAPVYTPVAIPTPAYTNPSGGPIMDTAKADFAGYQQSATKAAQNTLDAQTAQQQSLIDSGGIWATLQPIADKQMQDSMAALMQISTVAKANVEASRAALNAQDAADYAEVVDTLDKAVIASRQQSTEVMNQRGMFFSTVLDSVMGKVNAAYTTQKGQAAQQDKARLAKIASDMAVLSGNIDIETIKGNASAVAQYTAQMLQVVTQDAQTKQTAQALLASLKVQQAGILDTVAAQVFGTGQQMKATAFGQQSQLNADAANAAATLFSQQSQNSQMGFNQQVQQNADAANQANTAFSQQAQLRGEATDASNTAFTQNLQTNAATADATARAQQQFVSTIGQYSGDYQAAINALDPNDPEYAFKSGMLQSDRQAKIVGVADQARKDFLDTINQYAGDFQAQINKVANDGSTSNDWQLAYLKIGKMQKVSDQLVAEAEYDAAKAKADALALYQSNQLDLQWFNATTSRISASGSATGTSKAYAPSSGGGSGGGGSGGGGSKSGGGTVKAPPSAWTQTQARSFKAAYETVQNMVVGTIISETQAQDPNLVGGGVNLVAGTGWTQEQKDAYLSSNKRLYESAMNAINVSDLWNPNNPKFSPMFRSMLQQMINQGIQINEGNINLQILAQADEPSGRPGLSGATGGSLGADADYLMEEFNRNR